MKFVARSFLLMKHADVMLLDMSVAEVVEEVMPYFLSHLHLLLEDDTSVELLINCPAELTGTEVGWLWRKVKHLV